MALFSSADENALNARNIELDKRQSAIERQTAQLASQKEELERERSLLIQSRESVQTQRRKVADDQLEQDEKLAKRESDLHEREIAVTQREVEAKNSFVKQQQEAFREAIQERLSALDARATELDQLQEQISARLKDNIQQESDLAQRELSLRERELKADAGFASKTQELLDQLARREEAIKTRHAQQNEREKDLLRSRQSLEEKAGEIRKRISDVKRAEIDRDAGFSSDRQRLDDELHAKRTEAIHAIEVDAVSKREAFESELTAIRLERMNAIRSEFELVRVKLEEEAKEILLNAERVAAVRLDELRQAKSLHDEEKASFESGLEKLQFDQKRLSARITSVDVRESELADEVEQRVVDRRREFEELEQSLHEECSRLRGLLRSQDSILVAYEELKARLGESPEAALLRLNQHVEEIAKLRQDLDERPTAEMRQVYDEHRQELARLKAKLDESQTELQGHRERAANENDLRAKINELNAMNHSLESQKDSYERECLRLQDDQKRLQSAYARNAERDQLIRDVEAPQFKEIRTIAQAKDFEGVVSEIAWLDSIDRQCTEYGLRFPRRILHAFHTSLKTAEWSPLTVLAGVSGTGKSELPRLYSHFGGIQFLPLAVQPNWDSQESMLGFFNSIDNKFDAQPVLRFLAQSQKELTDDYPGLQDAVCLVLLDEMNLAHMELYFSDFLSKLEYRRGLKGGDTPNLEVKLGAGLEPYLLPMGRNVLWTGTMNQDETTKSLSDKVLDRSIVIHFPRPSKLERRQKLKSLTDPAPLLPRKAWQRWWAQETEFSDEQVQPFKSLIEHMNESLSEVGRALGHRVWQSIEYYMANYPDVRFAKESGDPHALERAMRIAFEDQLVQKVMPKLRGIDTRGDSQTKCLDPIRRKIVEGGYSIGEDFDLACKLGYGQFMWQTANYLQESMENENKSTVPDENGADQSEERIPESFKPDDPARESAWGNLTPKQRKMFMGTS